MLRDEIKMPAAFEQVRLGRAPFLDKSRDPGAPL
jgi:hypothetical protein